MVRNRANNNRRAATRRSNAPRRIRRMIDRLDYGVKFVPSADPPEFSRSPWWPVTLVFKPEAKSTYHYSEVATALKVFFGVKAFTGSDDKAFDPFLIRPQTVRMWGLDKQGINLEVFEIVGAGTHRVKQLADMGSGMNFSRVGWRFGVSAQIDPNIAASVPIFSVTPNGKCIVYLQVLICVANAFELSAFTDKPKPKPNREATASCSDELSLDAMSF